MKPIWLIILALALVAEATELGKLQDSFMSRYDATNQERDDGLKKLESSYVTALERHLDKVKASGKLERVIPVRDEIQAVQTDAGSLPELPESTDRELRSMRDKFVEAREKILETHAKSLIDLADKMEELLRKKEAELTKAGKIDDALSANRMRETLGSDEGIAGARQHLDINRQVGPQSRMPIQLREAKLRALEKRFSFYGLVTEPGLEALHAKAVNRYREIDDGRGELLVVPAPIRLELRFPREVTELDAEAYLGVVGDAIFRVHVAGELVKELDFEGDLNSSKQLKCKFSPTRSLVIEVDPKSEKDGAWTALSKGFVR